MAKRKNITSTRRRLHDSHLRHLGLSRAQARLIVPFLVLTLLVVGALASILLVFQTQELRQQASTITMSHGDGGRVLPTEGVAKRVQPESGGQTGVQKPAEKSAPRPCGDRASGTSWCVEMLGVSSVQTCSNGSIENTSCTFGRTCQQSGTSASCVTSPQQTSVGQTAPLPTQTTQPAPTVCSNGLRIGESRCDGNVLMSCDSKAQLRGQRCGDEQCRATRTTSGALTASCVEPPTPAADKACSDGTLVGRSTCSANGQSILTCTLSQNGAAYFVPAACRENYTCTEVDGSATCLEQQPEAETPGVNQLELPPLAIEGAASDLRVQQQPSTPPNFNTLTNRELARLAEDDALPVPEGTQFFGPSCGSWWGGHPVPPGYCNRREVPDLITKNQVCQNGIYYNPNQLNLPENYCDGKVLYPRETVTRIAEVQASRVVQAVGAVVQEVAQTVVSIRDGLHGLLFPPPASSTAQEATTQPVDDRSTGASRQDQPSLAESDAPPLLASCPVEWKVGDANPLISLANEQSDEYPWCRMSDSSLARVCPANEYFDGLISDPAACIAGLPRCVGAVSPNPWDIFVDGIQVDSSSAGKCHRGAENMGYVYYTCPVGSEQVGPFDGTGMYVSTAGKTAVSCRTIDRQVR